MFHAVSDDHFPTVLTTIREVSGRTLEEISHTQADEPMRKKARLLFALCTPGSTRSMAKQWLSLTGSSLMAMSDVELLAAGDAREPHARCYAEALALMADGVGITAAAQQAGINPKLASAIASLTGVAQWRSDELTSDAVLCRGDGEPYAQWAERHAPIGICTLRKAWATAGKVLAELEQAAA